MRQSPPRRTEKAQPDAAELLRSGTWTAEQVALLLDVEVPIVIRWCQMRLIPGAVWHDGRWQIPGTGLFFFCAGSFDRRVSPKTAAALMDVPLNTMKSWIKHGRSPKGKLGVAQSSLVRIKESDLRRFADHG